MPSLQLRLRLLVFPHQSSGNFRKQHLSSVVLTSNNLGFEERHRQRTAINGVRSRTRPLPWRSFGRPGTVGDDVIAERKLRWRARFIVEPHVASSRMRITIRAKYWLLIWPQSQQEDYLRLAIDLLSEFHEFPLSELTDFDRDVKFL
ncbi:hypothetical protein FNV43_RR00829 [Rhamnella rubrinervis]|uniref:Uncharacterized protein n=1 Tax=Rhamnella rubrinervis TaxID=2594499 RepID=A0A8K0HRF4_9ROSA|nr:hypothetical protein FNV43_RR00829 [Rhamnella rubrinervis]